jgi:hypothetical protein
MDGGGGGGGSKPMFGGVKKISTQIEKSNIRV